ncbi:MAG: SMI1/KNR4 family protein [Hyphomonadaceae bacterium]
MNRLERLAPVSPPQPVSASDVDAAEAAIGGPFPNGYRAFMLRFGRGLLGGLVRIYTPAAIMEGPQSFSEWRMRIDEYWFWDASAALLPKSRALECVVIGDTIGGDELALHPSEPDRIFVFAHDFDQIYPASTTGLEAAIDWFFTSGMLDEAFEDDSFEPY